MAAQTPLLDRSGATRRLAHVPDRRDVSSWLPGSEPRRPGDVPGSAEPSAFPGQSLGRPLDGPGSVAGLGRRFVSLMIDWVLCLLIARAAFGTAALHPPGTLWTNVIIGIENVLLVSTAGATLGQRILRIRVEKLDGTHPGPGPALLRGVLLALAVPALFVLWQRDHRGLHELASGTVTARW